MIVPLVHLLSQQRRPPIDIPIICVQLPVLRGQLAEGQLQRVHLGLVQRQRGSQQRLRTGVVLAGQALQIVVDGQRQLRDAHFFGAKPKAVEKDARIDDARRVPHVDDHVQRHGTRFDGPITCIRINDIAQVLFDFHQAIRRVCSLIE